MTEEAGPVAPVEPTAQQALNIIAGALEHPSLQLAKRDFVLIEKCLQILAKLVEDEKPVTNGNRAARRHPAPSSTEKV